jgi:hypothetical protein
MDHSWHQLSIATLGSGRARTRSRLAIPRVDERDHCAHVLGSFLALVCLEHPQPYYRPGRRMTLRPVNNSAAGVAQRPRTGRHFSRMSRRALPFVHLHRPVKAAYLKATVRAALEPIRKSGYQRPSPANARCWRCTRRRRTHHVPNDLGLPRDSRDEALDRAARNRSSANRSRGALKPVIADRWTRRFVERSLNMHKNALTPEETCWKID